MKAFSAVFVEFFMDFNYSVTFYGKYRRIEYLF